MFLATNIWDSIIESTPDNAPWKAQLEEQVKQFSKNQTNVQEQEILSMVEKLDKRLYSSDSKDIIQW